MTTPANDTRELIPLTFLAAAIRAECAGIKAETERRDWRITGMLERIGELCYQIERHAEGPPKEFPEVRVVEGIHGTWHYHLATPGQYVSLCGTKVMNTSIPMSGWGRSGNPELREHWCRKCESMSEIDQRTESR